MMLGVEVHIVRNPKGRQGIPQASPRRVQKNLSGFHAYKRQAMLVIMLVIRPFSKYIKVSWTRTDFGRNEAKSWEGGKKEGVKLVAGVGIEPTASRL